MLTPGSHSNCSAPGTPPVAGRRWQTKKSWRSSTLSPARNSNGARRPPVKDNIARLAEQEQDSSVEKRRKQADILIELAAAATLFHTAPDCDAFADITIDGHRETHRVRGQAFRRWLRHQ